MQLPSFWSLLSMQCSEKRGRWRREQGIKSTSWLMIRLAIERKPGLKQGLQILTRLRMLISSFNCYQRSRSGSAITNFMRQHPMLRWRWSSVLFALVELTRNVTVSQSMILPNYPTLIILSLLFHTQHRISTIANFWSLKELKG